MSRVDSFARFADLVARRRIFRKRDEEGSCTPRLHRQRFSQCRFGEHRNTKPVQALCGSSPLRTADRTHKQTLSETFAMRKKDLRAAALHIRLMAVGRGEIRELVLRSLARAAYERSAVAASIRLLGRLRPLGRALGAAERAFDCVEAAPLDDPVLAAVREGRSLL